MAIVRMKRLELVGLLSQREALLKQLQQLGCVEISPPEPVGEEALAQRLVRPDTEALARAREREATLESALKLLKEWAPEKKGLLTPLPQVTRERLFDREAFDRAMETAERVLEVQSRVSALRAEEDRLKGQRRSLEPWAELDVPLDTGDTRSVEVIFGAVKVNAPWETLTVQAAQIGPVELIRAGRDRELRYLLVLCHKSVTGEVTQALKPYGFVRTAPRGWTGAAGENLEKLDRRLAELEGELAKGAAELSELTERRGELRLALDRVRQELRREEARGRLLDTDAAYLLEGWFPAEDEGKVTELLEGYTAAWEMTEPTQEEYPQVPIKLKNNPVTAPFRVITEMYSLPAYDGVDPNPLMAPFFVLFFGFMMNDIGYGLLMVLGTAVFLKMARPRGTMRDMMTMFLMCGVSSIFWGCLTGSFFGDFLPKLFSLLGISDSFVWFWPPLFTPVNDIILVMIGSIALGAVQVFVGMAVSAVHKWRTGDPLGAVFEEGAWAVILMGAALALLGIGSVGGVPVVLLAGLGLLLAGNVRQNRGFGIITGFGGAIYNGVSGYFSDILSYLRLMALMMAGSIIASVFNTLGSVFGLVPFLIVALIGNTLNLVLNLLGCYVHTMRLQCLEFFGRFYKDGGKPFRPLTVETQYVNVLREEM